MPAFFWGGFPQPRPCLRSPAPKRGGGVHRLAQTGAEKPQAFGRSQRSDEVILSNPDDRLEPAGKDNCGTRDARAGSLQRIARTARREGPALPAGHHLRFPAQRPGARVCREARRGWLRRFRADHRRRSDAHPELHRQVRARVAAALHRGPGQAAHHHARPQTRTRAARAGAQAGNRSDRTHHRRRHPRDVHAAAGRPARRRAAVRQ